MLLFRFLLTFGLFILLFCIFLFLGLHPFKKHILETQALTEFKAKNRVLGYQTPNFILLAQNILTDHIFSPQELDDPRAGTTYLNFYKKASELFPEYFEMHYLKGVCYAWMGDIAQAKLSLQKALELNPTFFWAYYNLGLLYLKEGEAAAAIKLFSYAQKLPLPLTEKSLYDLQGFQIIWRYMPHAQEYVHRHLEYVHQQISDLSTIKTNQWHPIFF